MLEANCRLCFEKFLDGQSALRHNLHPSIKITRYTPPLVTGSAAFCLLRALDQKTKSTVFSVKVDFCSGLFQAFGYCSWEEVRGKTIGGKGNSLTEFL